MTSKLTRLLICVLPLLVFTGVTDAVEPAVNCQVKRMKLAGRYAQCRLEVEAEAALRVAAPDYARCDGKLAKGWRKVAAKGDCPLEGSLDAVERLTALQTQAIGSLMLPKPCGTSYPQCGGFCPQGQRCARLRTCGGVAPCGQGYYCAEPFDCVTSDCQCVPNHKKVFVTSFGFDGNFGGVAAADTLCQMFAANAGLPGSYLAWLTDGDPATSPAARFSKSSIPYARVDGMMVADNWADLTDGEVDNPIRVSEKGLDAPGRVYTNTDIDGTQLMADFHCGNWTNKNLDFIWKGDAIATTGDWTRPDPFIAPPQPNPGCGAIEDFDGSEQLYCFEQ